MLHSPPGYSYEALTWGIKPFYILDIMTCIQNINKILIFRRQNKREMNCQRVYHYHFTFGEVEAEKLGMPCLINKLKSWGILRKGGDWLLLSDWRFIFNRVTGQWTSFWDRLIVCCVSWPSDRAEKNVVVGIDRWLQHFWTHSQHVVNSDGRS